MKRITKLMLLTIGSVTLTMNASAASFNCHKASTKVEHAICDDKYLSQKDGEMGRVYHNASKHANLKHEQRDWVKHRNRSCGADQDCLYDLTEARIKELKRIIKRGGGTRKAHHKSVYSPIQGVVCDKKAGFCADSYGISAGYTDEYLGQGAGDKFFSRAGSNFDTTIFGMSNRVYCDSNARTCYEDKLKDKVDHYFTNKLYR